MASRRNGPWGIAPAVPTVRNRVIEAAYYRERALNRTQRPAPKPWQPSAKELEVAKALQTQSENWCVEYLGVSRALVDRVVGDIFIGRYKGLV